MDASAIAPGMTDAEKASGIWFQQIRHRHHSPGDNNELGDPVKVFNVYGYNTCGNDSICLATLWRRAGLKVAPARALAHSVSHVSYDNLCHFYDADMHCVYLLHDNQTLAGEQVIVRDHDLVKRTHSKGIVMPDTWWDGQGMCAMYVYAGEVGGRRGGETGPTLNMQLRSGEAIEWRWGNLTFAPELNLAILENCTSMPREQQIWTYRYADSQAKYQTAPKKQRATPPIIEDVVVSVVSKGQVEIDWPASRDKRVSGYEVERAAVEVWSEDQLRNLKQRTPPLPAPSVGSIRRVGGISAADGRTHQAHFIRRQLSRSR